MPSLGQWETWKRGEVFTLLDPGRHAGRAGHLPFRDLAFLKPATLQPRNAKKCSPTGLHGPKQHPHAWKASLPPRSLNTRHPRGPVTVRRHCHHQMQYCKGLPWVMCLTTPPSAHYHHNLTSHNASSTPKWKNKAIQITHVQRCGQFPIF